MPTEELRVIELAENHRRIVLDGTEVPLLQRAGDTDYRCGACGTVLVEQAWHWEVRNLVFRCPSCGVYNEVEK